jgi:hypothetical protein
MRQENKGLLLVDLCARLPYGVKVAISHFDEDGNLKRVSEPKIVDGYYDEKFTGPKCYGFGIYEVKPYLRPMSSMTNEERIEFSKLLVKRYCEEDWEGHISTSYCIEIDNVYTDDENGIKYPSAFSMDAIDWLNKNMFDYRGLIEKGLALKAPEGMYENK